MERAITLQSYKKLLCKIKNEMAEGLFRAQNAYDRERVITYWNMGRAISSHLLMHKDRADYGESLFNRLSQDIGLGERLLYQVTQFYNTYPDFKPSSNLKWSHYRILTSIKDENQRGMLEDKVSKEKLSKRKLEVLVKDRYKEVFRKEPKRPKKLKCIRGKLYIYKIIKVGHTKNLCIDLGFKVYRETEEIIKKVSFIETIKGEDRYDIKAIKANAKDLYIYKAYVDKIIDGDTIWLDVDLGFNTWLKHKARLRGIDTAPIETTEGQNALKYVKSVLKGLPFVIIKSHGRDKYDRHLIDLYYLRNAGEEKVLKEGIFLNQELLDKEMAYFLDWE